jgi:hypothetical protein
MRNLRVIHPTEKSDTDTENSVDPVFFRKHDLRVGTALRYYGRRHAGELLFVTGIFTSNQGRHVPRAETFPQTLDDLVRLKNHETGEVRFARFSYISYSALYRIED